MSQVENRTEGAGCLLLRSVSPRAAMLVSTQKPLGRSIVTSCRSARRPNFGHSTLVSVIPETVIRSACLQFTGEKARRAPSTGNRWHRRAGAFRLPKMPAIGFHLCGCQRGLSEVPRCGADFAASGRHRSELTRDRLPARCKRKRLGLCSPGSWHEHGTRRSEAAGSTARKPSQTFGRHSGLERRSASDACLSRPGEWLC
jgi:hypothetical protein